MALKDILNNAKYADDLVVTFTDGSTATLGEMRATAAEERAAVIQREKTVERAELAIAEKVQEFQKKGLLPSAGDPDPNRMSDKDIRRAAASEYGLDENDPLLGPIVKEFRAEMKKNSDSLAAMKNEFADALKKVTGVVQTAVGANLEERYQGEFSRATKDLPTGVKVDYEKAFQHASDLGLKDKYGRLDIAAAVDRLTWEDRKKAERAKLEEEATTAADQKARLAQIQRPRTAGPENHRSKTEFDPYTREQGKAPKVKSFDEALAAAQADDELMESALKFIPTGAIQ